VRLLDLVDPDAALLIFREVAPADAPVLSREQVSQIESDYPGVRAYFVTRAANLDPEMCEPLLIDEDGQLWRAWTARQATLALIRPDGHVGWASHQPKPEEVRRALRLVLCAPDVPVGCIRNSVALWSAVATTPLWL
jgi:hypothetical protein